MLSAKTTQSPPWFYLALWYAISAGLQLELALSKFWEFGVPWWRAPPAHWVPGACLVAAFLLSGAIAAILSSVSRGFQSVNRGWRLLLIAMCTLAIYGIVFLGLIVTKADYSRAITLAMFASALVTIPGPYLLGAARWQRASALCALLALAYFSPLVMSLISEKLTPVVTTELAAPRRSTLLKTAYYNLDVGTYPGPKSRVHGGALSRIANGYLLLTGEGQLYTFAVEKSDTPPSFTPLPYRVPINGEAFATAAGRPWTTAPPEVNETEINEVLNTGWFRTYGLLVQENGSDARIFVSHDYWNAAGDCWVERVSMLEGDREAILQGVATVGWKTLYETKPCLPVHGSHRRHGIPFVGYFGGGRMQLLDAQTLLLVVGDFGFDGVASIDTAPQDPTWSYGKSIAIKIADGQHSLFTLGNRNPQGLYIDRSGTIWSTEHGPQGGDELNRLIRGGNYGWPYATYGTDYGSFSWPLNKPESEWREYQSPVFVWLPSIAVSNLLVVEHGLFERWRDDLLIGSLKARTLFRAHLREGHVVYLEPIFIGDRIRDLIEGHDGRIILWTDDDTLISLIPKQGTTGEGLFAEKCGGCHQSAVASGNRIGPNLSGVVGRNVAALKDYPDYSPCLKRLGGAWTEDRLNAFIKEPRSVCPGTAMDLEGLASDTERMAIIRYLSTLKSS
jgi:aldose sugar dehydrogenase